MISEQDTKYCPQCNKRVRYLTSATLVEAGKGGSALIRRSYCFECDGEVKLFSPDEDLAFNQSLAERANRGGRPKKIAV